MSEQMDATALHVMWGVALSALVDCRERGDEPHYREIADVAVRNYIAGSRVAVRMSAGLRDAYAHEIVRRLLAKDARN